MFSRITPSFIKKALVTSSIALSTSNFVHAAWTDLPTCTDSILSYTQSSGCTLPAPSGAPSTADIGVRIFSPSLVNQNDAQAATEGLNKVVFYFGGYGGEDLSRPEMQALETLRQYGVSVIQMQMGPAGDDKVEHYSQQIQKLISQVNTFREGIDNPIKMVVIGYSLGGVGARHALATMEQANIPHNMSTYISFDAPHKGANVPQSIQRIKPIVDEYLAETKPFALGLSAIFSQYANQQIDFFKAIDAANLTANAYTGASNAISDVADAYVGAGIFDQLLINNVFNKNNDFAAFKASYEQLGYPKQTRNIAVANGSLQVDQTGYENGDKVISFSARAGGSNTYARLDLNTYDSQPGKLAVATKLDFKGTVTRKYKCFWFFTCTQAVAVGAPLPKSRNSGSDIIPLDSVPGGSNPNLSQVVYGMTKLALAANLTILNSPYYDKETKQLTAAAFSLVDESDLVNFSFLPTASALDLPVTLTKDELLEAVSNNATPFDKIVIKGDSTFGGTENKNFNHADLSLTPDLASELTTALNL